MELSVLKQSEEEFTCPIFKEKGSIDSYQDERERLELKVQKLEQELSRPKRSNQCDTCLEVRKENEELSQMCADLKNQSLRIELTHNQRTFHENLNRHASMDIDKMEKYNKLIEEYKQLQLENEDFNSQLRVLKNASKNLRIK